MSKLKQVFDVFQECLIFYSDFLEIILIYQRFWSFIGISFIRIMSEQFDFRWQTSYKKKAYISFNLEMGDKLKKDFFKIF